MVSGLFGTSVSTNATSRAVMATAAVTVAAVRTPRPLRTLTKQGHQHRRNHPAQQDGAVDGRPGTHRGRVTDGRRIGRNLECRQQREDAEPDRGQDHDTGEVGAAGQPVADQAVHGREDHGQHHASDERAQEAAEQLGAAAEHLHAVVVAAVGGRPGLLECQRGSDRPFGHQQGEDAGESAGDDAGQHEATEQLPEAGRVLHSRTIEDLGHAAASVARHAQRVPGVVEELMRGVAELGQQGAVVLGDQVQREESEQRHGPCPGGHRDPDAGRRRLGMRGGAPSGKAPFFHASWNVVVRAAAGLLTPGSQLTPTFPAAGMAASGVVGFAPRSQWRGPCRI